MDLRQRLFISLLALASLPGQQLIWEIRASNGDGYLGCSSFSDFDRDGVNDLLGYRYVAVSPGPLVSIRILSGASGSILYHRSMFPGFDMRQAGDFDGDGYDEFVWTSSFTLHVHSPRRDLELFRIPPASGPSPVQWPGGGEFAGALEASIDLDGDGRSDLLAATVTSFDSNLYAFDHLGTLRYLIPARPSGWVIRSVVNVGDRDGDGGEDFLVGALGGTQYEGGAFLFSGRTGTLLRQHRGLQPYDLIGGFVLNAGDIDNDGVPDYLAANEISIGSGRQVTIAWSGATGAVIQVWQDPGYQLGIPVSAMHDIDMDGLPDVLFRCPSCIDPVTLYWGGANVASSRDGWLLERTRAAFGQTNYGEFVVDLGLLPGSPHPVHAINFSDLINGSGTIQAFRSEPPRSSLTGTGCSTSSTPLVPGLRTTPTGSRLQLANAPPGALAWCILGDGNATTTSGYPLPVALDPLGFAGCSLLVPMDSVGVTTTGTVGIDRGYAAFDLPVALAATAGRRFAVQWLVLDPVTGFEAWTSRRDFWVQ